MKPAPVKAFRFKYHKYHKYQGGGGRGRISSKTAHPKNAPHTQVDYHKYLSTTTLMCVFTYLHITTTALNPDVCSDRDAVYHPLGIYGTNGT
jgi:hypothetical protein